MASLRDEVTDPVKYAESLRRFREYCQSWKSHQRRTAVENVVRLALEDNRDDDLYEVLLDEDYRALRRSMSGAATLRADLEKGRRYFSSQRPDLLRYMQIAFAEQAADDDMSSLASHRQNCREFADFLQLDRLSAELPDTGLNKVLSRFFPVSSDEPDYPGRAGGQVTIRLTGYELGEWACSCGRETGLRRRYDYACRCGSRNGNGRLTSGMVRCSGCGHSPAYARCAECGTRVTLASLWRLRRGGVDPSAYRIPLDLDLVVERPASQTQSVRFTLMHLPVPLGLRERDGQLTIGLPDMLWLGSFSGGPDASRFIGLSDQPRYDGRTELRETLEAAFRRTLWGRSRSYRGFENDLLNALVRRQVRPADLTAKYTRGFERRIGRNLGAREQNQGNLARFTEIAVDCQVAASAALRDRSVLVNRQLAGPEGLSAPHRLDVATALTGKKIRGTWITREPPGLAPDRCSTLDQWGLVSPGQLVEPGQVLIGAAISAPDEELSPEEILRRVIFGESTTTLKDASMVMPGERPGRVLSLSLRLHPGTGDAIPSGPGRSVERVGAREAQEIVVSMAVDQPVEAGDVLVGDNGSEAVVSGIFGGPALRAMAGSPAEPDLVVAPGHSWAPAPGGPPLRTVRVRLGGESLAGTAVRSRATGDYEPLSLRPRTGTGESCAQPLVSGDYYWLITHGARHMAFEMYGPRCDYLEWRSNLAESPPRNVTSVELPRTAGRDWASLQDSPSQAVRRWDMLLRSARILPRLDGEHITLRLMTDEEVLSSSRGEVSKPETINRRTLKPEKGGLFCEKVFGPVRDWECYCGKYKRVRFKGIICERCGVEVTRAKVRREWMGHIELPVPVVHSWYLRGRGGAWLAQFLSVSEEQLLGIAHHALGVVTDGGTTPLRRGQIVGRDQWDALLHEEHIRRPTIASGGEAVKIMLQEAATRQNTGFPDGIVIQQLPVLPPDMRPTEIMPSGTSERSYAPNHLYRNVLHRSRHLRSLIKLAAPEIVIFSQSLQLQASVDQLFDNAHHPKPEQVMGETVISLADLLAMQKWEFLRRPLDYSASTLLVTGETPGPDVALLPARLAFDLFEPMVVRILMQSGTAPDIASARELVKSRTPEATRALGETCADALILVSVNSAPWPVFAMRVQLSSELALQVQPSLLDDIGWEHLGSRASIFSILTAEAEDEARALLTPSRLRAGGTPPPIPDAMDRSAILDLVRDNAPDEISASVLEGRSHWITGWDRLFLGDADWLRG